MYRLCLVVHYVVLDAKVKDHGGQEPMHPLRAV